MLTDIKLPTMTLSFEILCICFYIPKTLIEFAETFQIKMGSVKIKTLKMLIQGTD